RHRGDPARLRRHGGAPEVVPVGTPALRTTCSAVWWLGSGQGAMTNRATATATTRSSTATTTRFTPWNSLRVTVRLLLSGQQEVDDQHGHAGEHVGAGGGGAPRGPGRRDQRWHRGLGHDVADDRRGRQPGDVDRVGVV